MSRMTNQEDTCRVCGRDMYWSPNVGCYSCRSDDCPPGTKDRRIQSKKEEEVLLADLRRRSPCEFASVEDLSCVVARCTHSLSPSIRTSLKEIESRLIRKDRPTETEEHR